MSSASDTPIVDEANVEVATSSLPVAIANQVQHSDSQPSSSSGKSSVSNHLGENAQLQAVEQIPMPRPDQPKHFWHLTSAELFAYALTKNQALRSDLKGDTFIAYDLSTENLLSMLNVESKNQLFTEIGLDPSSKLFKSIMFESFLIKEILSDNLIPKNIRDYWEKYQNSKHNVETLSAPPSPSQIQQSPIQRKIDFGAQSPSTIKIPGREGNIETPAFYKHIVGATSELFHVLSPCEAESRESPISMFGQDGKLSISLNLPQQSATVYKFPTLEAFNKLTVSPFLLAYKIAKLAAPEGFKKSLKSCINAIIWSDLARSCEVDLETFEKKTSDQTIYASMLAKYGPTTSDEACDLLKKLMFEFDDSTTPQEFFAGELSKHFGKVREQLAQFLYCKFEEGEELSSDACLLCLKDNFLHNPVIKGKDGNMVRKSSNNASILEKIHLNRHMPISEIMHKIVVGFEAQDKTSSRTGYKITPWRKEGDDRPRQQFKNGGIQKNPPRNFNPGPKMKPCCKCGRMHEPTIEKCLLFDHPDAGKEVEWPAGKPPLKADNWVDWIKGKEKTHPELVKEFKKKSEERRQGNRGGGGKPPRYPGNKYSNNQVNKKNCAAFEGKDVEGFLNDESDGAKHGSTVHDTSDGYHCDNTQSARSKVTLDDITEECFFAVARFRRGKAANGKNLPSSRRDKTLRALMDPGSMANFISEDALDRINIIEESDELRCQITQNEKPMGEVCRRCVRIQFKLDLLRKAEIKHVDWFIVSKDIKHDAVIGTKFCRENGYTTFHAKLTPWTKRIIGSPEDSEIKQDRAPESPPKSPDNRKDADTKLPVLTDEELAAKQSEFDAEMEHVPTEMFQKYCTKHPVTNVPIIRNPNAVGPRYITHTGAHASVENLGMMDEECKAIIAQENHRRQCKTVQVMSENRKVQEAFLSANEVEILQKTEKQAALDAEKFFRENERYLQPKDRFVPSKKHARYFENVEFNAYIATTSTTVPVPVAEPVSNRKFVNNQMVLIKGLVNHTDLNNAPARILSYDDEKQLYTISVSKPRGYWHV